LRAQVGRAQQKNHLRRKLRCTKKKFLTKLVVGKDEKAFDAIERRLVDDTLGNEFLNRFLLRNDPVLGVTIDVHCFKRAPTNIVYWPFSDIHNDKIFKKKK